MKRILCTVLVLTTLLLSVFGLTSCKSGDELPEGMQLVRGGAEYGYNLYAPEEWTVSNRGDIACAYVSKLDSTNVTLVEAETPEGEIKDYFNGEMAKMPFPVTVGVECEATSFGNATRAYKATYTYEYGEAEIGVMQIFAYSGERFYIFTYTSTTKEKEGGVSHYDFYLEKLSSIIENVTFLEKSGEVAAPEYERTEDGWLIVSDKGLAGFVLAVPECYSVDYSSGIVSVTREDGTNISMSKATYTGVDKDSYWQKRKADLTPFVDKTVDGEGKEITTLKEVEGGISVAVELEGVKWAYSYEYTYRLEGEEYHVYQVLIVKGMNGFVFTYTASEADYASHIDEAKGILSRIEY